MNSAITAACSSLRNSPLSTRMQDSCGPIAWYSRAAVTDESTPPDRPQITRALPTLRANLLDRLLGEVAQPPGPLAAADGHQEVAQHQAAQRRVRHFGMELQAVDRQRLVLDRRDRAGAGAGQGNEVVRHRGHLIAVTHPDVRSRRAARRTDRIAPGRRGSEPGRTRGWPSCRPSAQGLAGQLHPVTDAQHRNPQLEELGIALRCAPVVDARRTAGEDQAAWGVLRIWSAEMSCRTISQ